MGEQRDSLRSDRGATSIGDAVVSKIAGIAAQEVEKVQMGGGTAAAVGSFLGNVTGGVTGGNSVGGSASLTSGVFVEGGEEEAGLHPAQGGEKGKPVPPT